MLFLPQGTKEFGAYWNEMKYCVEFALCNRRLMMLRIQEVLADALEGIEFEPMINIAHNYAAVEHHFGKDAENGGYPPTQNGDIRSLFWLFSLMALQN